MKRTFLDFLLTLVLLAAIAVFCYAGYNLLTIYMEYKEGVDEYNNIAKMAVTERDPDEHMRAADAGRAAAEAEGSEEGSPDDTQRPEQTDETIIPPMAIDFAALQAVNSDVIGWIYVEALDGVNYPVVRGEDNSYYLHMTYQHNYNFAGTIFMDYANSRDFNDCNTLIYGHNMKNGSMFGQLKNYTTDEKTYRKSPYFWIFTPTASYRYEIIAAYTTAVNSDTYTLFKGPGAEFEEYLKKIVGYSQLPERPQNLEQLNMMDKIVTLSTCTGNEATRYVVQGRRINTVRNS